MHTNKARVFIAELSTMFMQLIVTVRPSSPYVV